jgi:tRNA threonylcarbamoyl adenosine modification protein YeaZ
MKVLGIETSTDQGSVALVEDEKILGELLWNLPRSHSQKLIPSIEALLRIVGIDLKEIEAICVGLGPGSFTGLRVGLSVAKGLAFTLGAKIVGIPSFDALAWDFKESDSLCILSDAKRGLLFFGFYQKGKRIGDLKALRPEEVLSFLKDKKKVTLMGDGAFLYRSMFEKEDLLIYPTPVYPKASSLALLGLRKILLYGEDELSSLSPLYLIAPALKEKGGQSPPSW